jgi:hypothetical protein
VQCLPIRLDAAPHNESTKQEAHMRTIIALALPLIAAFGTSGLMFTATLV